MLVFVRGERGEGRGREGRGGKKLTEDLEILDISK